MAVTEEDLEELAELEARAMARRPDTVRVSLRMTQGVKEQLDDVQARCGAESIGETVRRALAVYETLLEQRERGRVVLVRGDDGVERELVLVW